MEFAKILKANPYHDETGKFTTKDKAKFVSTGGVFDKQRANAKARTGEDKPDFKDRSMDDEFAEDHKKKLDSIPDSQREALLFYTGMGYEKINTHLRRGEPVDDDIKDVISRMDAAMNSKHSTLGKDVIAYRGINGAYSKLLRELHEEGRLIGSTLEDKGFSSVTVDKTVAEDWSMTVNMELKIPKTAKGFFVGHGKGEAKFYTSFENEREIIMDRGGKIKITGARKDGKRLIIEGDWV